MKILFLVFAIFLLAGTAVAGTVDEYEKEFSDQNSLCVRADVLSYQYSPDVKFSNIDFFYCQESDQNLLIPFDSGNENQLSEDQLKDILITRGIIIKIQQGEISKTVPAYTEGTGICSIYGIDTVTQETANWVGSNQEIITENLPKNAAKITKAIITTGKKLEIIKEFDPRALALGASCKIANDKIKAGIEKFTSCQAYVQNLAQKQAYYGITKDLATCNQEALQKLTEAQNDILVQVKGIGDAIYTVGKAILDVILNLMNGSTQAPTIQKTDLEIIQEAKQITQQNSISIGTPSDPDIAPILTWFKTKNDQTQQTITEAQTQINQLEKNLPNQILEKIANILLAPNKDTSQASQKLDEAKKTMRGAIHQKEKSRFKTAKESAIQAKELAITGNDIVNNENQKTQSISLFFVTIILVVAGIAYARQQSWI